MWHPTQPQSPYGPYSRAYGGAYTTGAYTGGAYGSGAYSGGAYSGGAYVGGVYTGGACGAGAQHPQSAPPPRKRLSGKLVEWTDDFGWIEPDEPIHHPDMARTSGLLHVAQRDILGGVVPEAGSEVEFTIFSDG